MRKSAPAAEIRARGGKPKSRRHKEIKLSAAPPVPTVGQLEKRLADASKTLGGALLRLPVNLRAQYRDGYNAPRESMEAKVLARRAQRKIGRAVARLLAVKGIHARRSKFAVMEQCDYLRLDEAVGRKVERQSKVPKGQLDRSDSYLGWIVRNYCGSHRFGMEKSAPWKPSDSDNCIAVFLRVKGEVEYLAELVRLAKGKA